MAGEQGYAVVRADDVEDAYAGSDVPGEFRPLAEALDSEQVAVTLIRVPPHSDFEQGTGHFHDEIEELYIVAAGTLTMRFGDAVELVHAGSVARVAPAHAALAPQRGRRAGRAVGGVEAPPPQGRDEARRLLGGVARGRADAHLTIGDAPPPSPRIRPCRRPGS